MGSMAQRMGSMVVPLTEKGKKKKIEKNKKDEILQSLFNRWRRFDSFGAFFANLSLLISVVYYEADVLYYRKTLEE